MHWKRPWHASIANSGWTHLLPKEPSRFILRMDLDSSSDKWGANLVIIHFSNPSRIIFRLEYISYRCISWLHFIPMNGRSTLLKLKEATESRWSYQVTVGIQIHQNRICWFFMPQLEMELWKCRCVALSVVC